MEHNLQTNFVPLIEHGVNITGYTGQHLDTKSQPAPDVVLDFSTQESFNSKLIHGMDQKSGSAQYGDGVLFSGISDDLYATKLRRLNALYKHKFSFDEPQLYNISQALTELAKTSHNIEKHQLVWATNVHLFEKSMLIPPMKLPNHFSVQDLTSQNLLKIQEASLHIKEVSNFLYFRKVSEVTCATGELSEEVLNLFNDTYLQKLLSDAPY